MLFSVALILFCGFALGGIMKTCRLPALLGMMLTGVLLGPNVFDLIDPSILSASVELREIALVVILIRAGLAMDLKDLRRVGRPAFLMSFVPATFELAAVVIFAPLLLGVSYLDAALLGAVLAAVSPAVVVPRMLKLMGTGYGRDKSIPQLILAGASVDDIYVIVLFASFTGMYQGQSFDFLSLLRVPISVVSGLILGTLTGYVIVWMFKKITMRGTIRMLLVLAVSFLFVELESAVRAYVPISGLLAVMALGGTILKKDGTLAKQMSAKLSKTWVVAELLLFVLIGAAVDIGYIGKAGMMAVYLLILALLFRIAGVYFSLFKTELNRKEKLFCAISYLPKATVQAAIGGVPLSLGIATGHTILAVAVLAIVITAPIGAIGVDLTYKRLLTQGRMAN
ncbi:MAG: sodium:proton antiporter [Firmicutes bacterium]|nr:sodium:proton antiporter [Bacillota bacterium]